MAPKKKRATTPRSATKSAKARKTARKPSRPAKPKSHASRAGRDEVVYTDVRREMRGRLLGKLL